MRNPSRVRFFLMSWLIGAAAASADEIYTAKLVAPRGIREDKTAQITLTIQQFSTEEDGAKLQKTYEEQGSDGLMKALREMDRGVVRVEGGLTARINHVRVYPGQGGQRVIIVTDKPLYFPEDTPDVRSRGSLGIIQLDLNNQGQGRGTLAEALKIGIRDDGVLEVEGHGTTSIRMDDVRRQQ